MAFEPFDTNEPLPRAMVALALFGALLLTCGLWRGWVAWRATAQMTAEWRRAGRPLAGLDTRFPVYAIDAPGPVVALVGIRRPTLFIANCVLAECSTAEVRAMIGHETAHFRAFDNARRFVIRACPDLMQTFDPDTSLYEKLAGDYGIQLMITEEVIEVGKANAEEAQLLQIPRQSPVFLFTRVSFRDNGKPVEHVKSTYRGDRYKIVNRLMRTKREMLATPIEMCPNNWPSSV